MPVLVHFVNDGTAHRNLTLGVRMLKQHDIHRRCARHQRFWLRGAIASAILVRHFPLWVISERQISLTAKRRQLDSGPTLAIDHTAAGQTSEELCPLMGEA